MSGSLKPFSWGVLNGPYPPTVYIAGPMRGFDDFNRAAFNRAAEAWLAKGWVVINPARHEDGHPIDAYVRVDTTDIMNLAKESNDAIAVLPGWEKSVGAKAEVALAQWRELPVYKAEEVAKPGDPSHFGPIFVAGSQPAPEEKSLKEESSVPDATGDDGQKREFSTGANRDTEAGKIVPTGFLSPVALLAFCHYMDRHRVMKDGKLREPDNWKKGIPQEAYFRSLGRHMLELELAWADSSYSVYPEEKHPSRVWRLTDTLCAIMFNAQGLLHEIGQELEAEDKAVFGD